MLKRVFVFSGIILLLFSISSFAAVPKLINVQGKLTYSTGTPETGNKTVTFKIVNAAGVEQWSDAVNVILDSQGQFSTVLGRGASLEIDFSQPLSVEVVYNGQNFSPKQPFSAVPYAFYAITAESVVGGVKWTTSGSDIYYNTGNVGIGTTEARQKLSVYGTIETYGTGGVKFPDGSTQLTASGTTAAGFVLKGGDTMTGTLNLPLNGLTVGTSELVVSGGKVGIGTAEPTSTLDVAGTAKFRGAAGGTGLYVNSGGNVGIGTTNPENNLQISSPSNSTIIGSDIIYFKQMSFQITYEVARIAPYYTFNVMNGWPFTGHLQFITATGGTVMTLGGIESGRASNVGIGTTEPTSKLTVAGTIEMTSGSGGGIKFPNGVIQTQASIMSGTTGYIPTFTGASSLGNSQISTVGTKEVNIMSTLHVTGMTDNGTGLTVTGGGISTIGWLNSFQLTSGGISNICAWADGNIHLVSSDIRLKKNIVGIAEQLDVLGSLKKLRGVYFNWDTSLERAKGMGEQREMGMIAQEVEPVLPEVVGTDKDGYKSLDYPKLTGFLIEVCKEQQKEIVELKTKVDGQQNDIEALKEDIKLLKGQAR